jgi:tartrate-resistant acid phosphatase type 5
MSATYDAFHEGPVDCVALDTNQITFDPMFGSKTSTAAQAAWIDPSIPTLAGPWRIVMGHHPYLSNGDHGNAGNYSGNETLNALALASLSALGGSAQNATQSFQGKAVKEFLEAHVCGKVDVYFAGHDHSLQDLKKPTSCATEFIVSGAGGSHTKVVEDRNPYWFQSAEDGFLIAEATRTKLVLTFFNKTGDQLHTRTLTK